MSYDFSLPLNTVLSLVILYYLRNIIFPTVKTPDVVPTDYNNSYSWRPKDHPPTVIYQKYTPKTLEKYNGKDDPRILLAIKGTVFDVTQGRSFYGPGPPPLLIVPA